MRAARNGVLVHVATSLQHDHHLRVSLHLQALAGRHYNEQVHGLLTAAGSTVYLVDGAHRTLVLHEVSLLMAANPLARVRCSISACPPCTTFLPAGKKQCCSLLMDWCASGQLV
jgi:hypothetical protein